MQQEAHGSASDWASPKKVKHNPVKYLKVTVYRKPGWREKDQLIDTTRMQILSTGHFIRQLTGIKQKGRREGGCPRLEGTYEKKITKWEVKNLFES